MKRKWKGNSKETGHWIICPPVVSIMVALPFIPRKTPNQRGLQPRWRSFSTRPLVGVWSVGGVVSSSSNVRLYWREKGNFFFFFFFGAVGSSVPFGGGFFFLIFNFLNAPSVHVVGSPLVVFHVLVVGGALAVAQWSSHFSLALVVITALSCNEHFDVSAADTRHSISFGACVVDHGRKLASASVDEPVGNLIC